jgi:hypothetical protein
MSDLAYRLQPEQLACIEDAARRVPEGDRDRFFKDVSDRLRPIPELRASDVRHHCAIVIFKLRGKSADDAV